MTLSFMFDVKNIDKRLYYSFREETFYATQLFDTD